MLPRPLDHPRSDAPRTRLIELRTVRDGNGNLTVCEAGIDLPFPIARAFFIWGAPGSASRGAHAHRTNRQVLVAVAGHFDVLVDDGRSSREVRLDRPDCGLLIEPMTWTCVRGMSPGAVCLVLASRPFDESDYIREMDEFRRELRP